MSLNPKKEENEFLPFAKPSLSEEAIADVVACLRSGWITTGPRVQQFESDLKKYFDAPHAMTMSSATAGLYMALKALELDDGDEVITTPFTFVATLNVIELAGLKPVLVDIDPVTYNIDVAKIAEKITPKTKAIMPVHFAGLPVDLDPLYELANKFNLRVVEDCAQAMGASYRGKKLGSFGDIQVFSFHPNKNMTTGEGGAIVCRDDDLNRRLLPLKFHGIDRSAWDRFSKKGTQDYDVLAPAHKFNMMDIQAAIGIDQLKHLDSFIEKRTRLAKRYFEMLADIDALILPSDICHPNDVHNWHLFTVRIDSEKSKLTRHEFMEKLKEYDIGSGLHYNPAHLYSFYKNKYGFKQGDFPNAEKVGATIVSLPLFPDLTFEQQSRVVNAIKKIFS